MAINYINTGSSANKGDGDSIRSAFTKVNANFTYLTQLVGTTATDFTEIAQDAVSEAFLHSNHYGLTADYNDVDNQIILTVSAVADQSLNTDSSVTFADVSADTGNFSTINATSLNLGEDILARSIKVSRDVVGHDGAFTGTIFQGLIPVDYVVHPGTFINVTNDYSGYTQQVIKNNNTGNTATSDIIFLNDQGDLVSENNLLDIGINSSNYFESAYGVHPPGSGYMFTNGVDLVIGTKSLDNRLIFHAGDTAVASTVGWVDKDGWRFNKSVVIADDKTGSQEVVLQNRNSDPQASASFIIKNDSESYLKLGINSSNSSTGNIQGSDAFIHTGPNGGTLHIGNNSSIAFYANDIDGYNGTATIFVDYQTQNTTFAGSIKPHSNNQYDLGTPTRSWGTVFAQTIRFNAAPFTPDYGSVEWTSTGLNFVSYERPLEITVADTGTNYSKWKFDAIGGMQFPDGTIQTTAYTGQAGDGAVLGLEIDGGNASTQDLELDIDGGGA